MVILENIQEFSNYIHKTKKKGQNTSIALFYFEFAFLVMQNPFFSVTLEFISGLFRLIQFLSITLNQNFSNCWTESTFFTIITGFFDYLNVVPLIKGNDTIYIIVFYFVVVGMILILSTWVFLIKYSVTTQQTNTLVFRIFKFLLVVLSSCFYVPLIKVLLGLLWKENGKYVFFTSTSLTEVFRFVHVIIGCVFSLLLITFSFLTQSVLFEIRYSKERKYAKTSCKCDVEIILGQSFLVVLTILVDDQWVKIIFAVIISFIILIDYFSLRPYYNNFLSKSYFMFVSIFAWSAVILLLARLIHHFTGAIYLFFIGCPIIVFACSQNHDESITLIMKTISKCDTQVQSLKHIEYLLSVIQEKENGRRAKIIIDGYIRLFEENCHIANCTLYKYLNSTEKKQYKTLLYQHVEELYKIAIKRFPEYVKLRISYANFMNDVMKKKTESLVILSHNLLVTPSLEDQFLIYRIRREITEDTYLNANSNATLKADSAANVSMANLNYKNKFMEFRQQMTDVSSFYVEFWNLLMTEGSEAEKLLKLNNIGTKITEKVEECDISFNKLHKMNPIDYLVLFYYSEFLCKVTNKVELANKYKNDYEKILQDIHFEEKEDAFLSAINAGSQNQSDEYQYIIASSTPENFGIIKNISLNFCINLGYTREELIGKHTNIIIPEIFRKSHDDILKLKFNQFKDIEYSEESKNDQHSFKNIRTFATGKSKYLIEFNARVGMIHTEISGDLFMARSFKVLKDDLKENTNNTCYVLTNINFGIQTFTPSANALLGLNTNLINTNFDMTRLIREFYEKFLEKMMEIEKEKEEKSRDFGTVNASYGMSKDKKKSSQSITKLRREIAETYFSKPTLVNLRSIFMNDDKEEKGEGKEASGFEKNLIPVSYSRRFSKTGFLNSFGESKFRLSSFNGNKTPEGNREFMFDARKVLFGNVHKGYYLRFQKLASAKKEVKIEEEKKTAEDSQNFSSAARRREEAKEDMDNLMINIGNIIDKNKGTSFLIDPEKLSYVPNSKEKIGDTRNKLKEIALNKIKVTIEGPQENKEEVEKSESSNAKSSETSELNSSQYSSGSKNSEESYEEEEEQEEQEDQDTSPKSKVVQNRNVDSNYYQVNFSCIQLYKYNYKSNRFNEVSYEKISQVEFVMNKDNKKQKAATEKQGAESGNVERAEEKTESSEFGEIQKEISKSTSHQILENTLSKKETQPSLVCLKICSASTFFLIVVFIALWYYFINYSVQQLNKNFKIIEKGYNLTSCLLNSMNYVRQLTLIQNTNFTRYHYGTREADMENLINHLKSMYEKQHTIMKEIITTNLPLKKHNEDYLDSGVVNMSIISPETFTKNTFEANFQSAITEGYTALRHIIVDNKVPDDFIPTDTNIYFYLENSIKGIYTAEEEQILVYSSDLKLKVEDIHRTMVLILILTIPIFFVCYFFIVCYFRRTTKRKEQYLIIFFDIGINVIKGLLTNCEIFNNKIQSESVIDFFNEDENLENDMDLDAVTQMQEDKMKRQNNRTKKNHIEHIDASAQENLNLEIILGAFFIVIFILNFLIYFFADTSVRSYNDYLEIFSNQMDNNNEYRKLFINTREYAFGTNNFIGLDEDAKTLTEYFQNFQIRIAKKENYDLKQKVLAQYFLSKLFTFNQRNLCEVLETVDKERCSQVRDVGIYYGLDVGLNGYYYYLRKIKTHVDFVNNYAESKGFKYNLTLHGTSEEFDLVPANNTDYYKQHPINTFNDVNFVMAERGYHWVIDPAFEEIFSAFTGEVRYIFKNALLIYNVVLGCFAVIVILCYFGIWVRFETKLNNTIYKTKNMLSIIPVNILCNIPTVFQVLEIKSMIKGTDGKRTVKSSTAEEAVPLVHADGSHPPEGANATTTTGPAPSTDKKS